MRNYFVFAAWALFLALSFTSCEKEIIDIENETGNAPAITADGISPGTGICSDVVAFDLIDAQQSSDIQYCGFLPCTGFEGSWANVQVYNTDTEIIIEIEMSFGWYIKDLDYRLGSISTGNGNLPVIGSDWTSLQLNTGPQSYTLAIPIGQAAGCTDLAVRLTTFKLDFFSGEDANSVTDLWLNNPDWNNTAQPDENTASPFVAKVCIASCGPVETVVTDGTCFKCDAEVTVTFIDCDEITVSSCKDLSNVVLAYTDGSWQKFNGLTSPTGTFFGTGSHTGKEISHAYIKSGCFRSGEGPGFGRRFDGPCVNP